MRNVARPVLHGAYRRMYLFFFVFPSFPPACHVVQVAIKEATGSLDIASKIRALCPIPILSGDDTLTLPLMSIGGRGVISVLSNVAPELVKSIVDAANAGDWVEAGNNHCYLHRLMRTMFIDTNPVPVKEAAKVMGIITHASVRLPMAPIEPAKRDILMACLRDYKLIQ